MAQLPACLGALNDLAGGLATAEFADRGPFETVVSLHEQPRSLVVSAFAVDHESPSLFVVQQLRRAGIGQGLVEALDLPAATFRARCLEDVPALGLRGSGMLHGPTRGQRLGVNAKVGEGW